MSESCVTSNGAAAVVGGATVAGGCVVVATVGGEVVVVVASRGARRCDGCARRHARCRRSALSLRLRGGELLPHAAAMIESAPRRIDTRTAPRARHEPYPTNSASSPTRTRVRSHHAARGRARAGRRVPRRPSGADPHRRRQPRQGRHRLRRDHDRPRERPPRRRRSRPTTTATPVTAMPAFTGTVETITAADVPSSYRGLPGRTRPVAHAAHELLGIRRTAACRARWW